MNRTIEKNEQRNRDIFDIDLDDVNIDENNLMDFAERILFDDFETVMKVEEQLYPTNRVQELPWILGSLSSPDSDTSMSSCNDTTDAALHHIGEEFEFDDYVNSWGNENSQISSSHVSHGVINFNIDKMLKSSSIRQEPEGYSLNSQLETTSCEPYNMTMETETNMKQDNCQPKQIPLCTVCTKPALKYSSYGGVACSSCRSFFRRSAQKERFRDYKCHKDKMCIISSDTRRNCQQCRFQACIQAGMKVTWVLSEEERKRRFGEKKKIFDEEKTNVPSLIRSNINLSFTVEEGKVLEFTHYKFQVPWLQNLLFYDKDSAKNFLAFTFKYDDFEIKTWNKLSDSMHLNFIKNVLPNFEELTNLPSQDFGQLVSSKLSEIQLFFRGCFAMDMTNGQTECLFSYHVLSQVETLLDNQDIMNTPELNDLFSKLDISKSRKQMRVASYEDIYPKNWLGNLDKEKKYRKIVEKIVRWPIISGDQVDPYLVTLMSLILLLNPDFYALKNRQNMEDLQLKYILILQRYLKSKLGSSVASNKFLEGMLLISHCREAWEMKNKLKL